MLRIFPSKCCSSVSFRCTFLTCVKAASRMSPIIRIKRDRNQLLVRHFCRSFERKDPQTGAGEALDLDKWKSVMREQATFQEQRAREEGEATQAAGGEEGRKAGHDVTESCSLEATRDLVSMWRQAGKLVPQNMTEEELQTLAELTTKSSRKKYLKYLAIKEGHKMARREKQQQKAAERAASTEARTGLDQQHGEKLKNSLFLQFWDRSLDRFLAWRAAQAMLFGQPLVFDMSYESSMSRRELENTVSQLLELEGWNRRAAEPFHLHFCSLQPNSLYMKELLRRYGADAWERLLVTSTDRPHVHLFPRERLVYLTADSPNVLRTFDHSKVYVIGALVDRSIQSGLSLAKAKRLKLATARLPLDEFLHWDMGAKNLTLDQMMRILLTMKDTGRWEEALEFVPKRKHDGFYQQQAPESPSRTEEGQQGGSTQQPRRGGGGKRAQSGKTRMKSHTEERKTTNKKPGMARLKQSATDV